MTLFKKFAMRTAVAAAMALILAGCLPGNNAPAPGDAMGQMESRGDVNLYRDIEFQDIPVPQEYTLIDRASHSFQGSMFRSGFFVYDGPLDWGLALDFFRTQMPIAGWNLETTERGFDFRVFRFRKGPEQLLITVRQIRNGSLAEIQLDNIERNDLLLRGKLPSEKTGLR